MWPPYQKSGSRKVNLREPLWLSWLETFHIHCVHYMLLMSICDIVVTMKIKGPYNN